MKSIFPLAGLLTALFTSGCTFSQQPARQTLSPVPQRTVSLRLLQEGGPTSSPLSTHGGTEQARKSLTDWRWRCVGAVNILGQGTDTLLDFAWSDRAGLTVRRTFVRVEHWTTEPEDHPKVITEGSYSCEICGPVLRLGNEVQTFFVSAGEKRLILGAVVRLKDGRWYCALPAPVTDGKVRPSSNEFLFDFSDNPMLHDHGVGKLQAVLRNEIVAVQPVTFDRPLTDGSIRVLPEETGRSRFEWAFITFAQDGSYGSIADQDHINSRVFTAIPKQDLHDSRPLDQRLR